MSRPEMPVIRGLDQGPVRQVQARWREPGLAEEQHEVERSSPSWRPGPAATDEEIEALERAAPSYGARVEREPPRRRQNTISEYAQLSSRYRPDPWWRTDTGMVKVIGAIVTGLALLGVGNLLTRRDEPPTPVIDKCPDFMDENTKRSPVCAEIWTLQKAIGTMQAQLSDARAKLKRAEDLGETIPRIEGLRKKRPATDD